MAPACLALPPNAAKWLYLAGFVGQSIAMWVLRAYGDRVLRFAGPLAKCTAGDAPAAAEAACIGKGAVLRLAWGGVIFFGAHALLTAGVTRANNPRRLFHSGCPPLQMVVWAGLCASAFAIPNNVFVGFGQAARVLAAIFLVFQIIILIDFIFGMNEWLLDRESAAGLVAGSALFYGGGLAGLGVLYRFWAPRASCSLHIFLITWTLVMAVVYTALSMTPWRPPAAGLLTSGAVFAYTVYAAWSALASVPEGAACAPAGSSTSRGGTLALRIVGLILTFCSLAYTTVSSSTEHSKFSTTAAGGARPGGAADAEAPATADGEDADLPYRPDFFSLIFATGTAFAAMVFLSWDTAGLANPSALTVDRGWLSFWVKAVAQWVCAALYAWALVAPALLKDREFA